VSASGADVDAGAAPGSAALSIGASGASLGAGVSVGWKEARASATFTDEGLIHRFIGSSETVQLPILTGPPQDRQRLGGFEDRATFSGGFQSATGYVAKSFYQAHPSAFSAGSRWVAIDQRTGQVIFSGRLKQAADGPGVVYLSADGDGLRFEKRFERLLFASQATDQWAPGDEDPFEFDRSGRFEVKVRGNHLVFEVPRFTSFRKNRAGKPSAWYSAPLVFWAPKVDIRWVRFDVEVSGPSMSAYDLELVGIDEGPVGKVVVIDSWALGQRSRTVDRKVPAGYDLVGLRLKRSTQVKKAPHNRVVLSNVYVGSIASETVYTLDKAFKELFSRAGITKTEVAQSGVNILPYDAAKATLADVADDLAVFGGWFWRVWAEPEPSTALVGEAGPLGAVTWRVVVQQTPVRLYPARQYNVVRYTYRYPGGYESQGEVRASVDPFPSLDEVYDLSLPEPPIEPLARRVAQVIVDLLSQPWTAGGATLYTVRKPGDTTEVPATVVRPGDAVEFAEYPNVRAIVEEVSHSEDGALTEVRFADSPRLVERWLAMYQQRLNRGLSPDGAALSLLGAREPVAPNLLAGFVNTVTKSGKKDFDLVAEVQEVLEDVDGEGTWVPVYEFRARPLDASSGNPIPESEGGGWRHRRIRATYDGDPDEALRVTWKDIPHPNKWAWEVQAWAVDALGQRSAISKAFPGKPAAFGPPDPVSASIDVDRRVITVTHVIPDDPADPDQPHPGYHHAIIKVNDQNGGWSNPLRRDRVVKGETRRFRFHKPLDNQLYYAQITYVDYWGNKSNPLVVSGQKSVPPLPTITSTEFDLAGTRHARYRAHIEVAVNDAGHDDHVTRVLVQFVSKATNAIPTSSDRIRREWVRVGDSPQSATFVNIRKRHYCFVRALSQDSDGKESGFTSWIALGRPIDSSASAPPPPPDSLSVTAPTPRRVVAEWEDPTDDEEVAKYLVEVRKGSTVVATKRTRDLRYVYRVPVADTGVSHEVRVWSLNDAGEQSATYVSGSVVPDPDAAGGKEKAVFHVRGRLRPIAEAESGELDIDEPMKIIKVRARVRQAPTGSDIIIKVWQNNTTLVTTVTIPAGNKRGVQDGLSVNVADGDSLSVEIVQVGSTFPGKHLTLKVVMEP
jgi:hypothetical protein